MMKNQKRAVCLLACLLIAGFTAAQEKKESAQTASGSKEEGNRNVMLNASSANGPGAGFQTGGPLVESDDRRETES